MKFDTVGKGAVPYKLLKKSMGKKNVFGQKITDSVVLNAEAFISAIT